jgi:hypothetical protein
MNTTTETKARLEYIRGELRAECISWEELRELQTLAKSGAIDPSDTELLEAAGVEEDAKAPAKPLWQMDVRHALDLSPGKTDPVSTLLFRALAHSDDVREFEERVQNHIEELRRALETLKAGAK